MFAPVRACQNRDDKWAHESSYAHLLFKWDLTICLVPLMSRRVKRKWSPNPDLPAPPRHEMPFEYEAFVPDEIASLNPSVSATVARVIQEADEAVRELNGATPKLTGLEALSRQLLRQESVASSRIEGLVMSHRRLARAAIADPEQYRDTSAESILSNIDAMDFAIDTTSKQSTITVENVIAIHRVLLEKTRDKHFAGVVRQTQNWIGGNNFNPRGAAFVPPPESEVERLLIDLALFLNRRDISTTLQAAIAHAQFETIHPFIDGNGRVGRCLIHVLYRRSKLAQTFVPPVSLVLATDADAYVNGLTAFRSGRSEDWFLDFASTVIKACRAARHLADRIDELEEKWMKMAGNPRAGSTSRKLLELLPAKPILRAADVIEITGASSSAANRAVNDLLKAGVLSQVTVGKRNRAWEAAGLLKLVDEFERSLATLDVGDGKPARPAPFIN